MDLYKTNMNHLETTPIPEKQDGGFENIERNVSVPERVANHENTDQVARLNADSASSARSQEFAKFSSSVVREPISVAGRYANVAAEDNDVIERQWVDGVKRTVAETKNQPMRRSDEIEETKRIYQQKRRGY